MRTDLFEKKKRKNLEFCATIKSNIFYLEKKNKCMIKKQLIAESILKTRKE